MEIQLLQTSRNVYLMPVNALSLALSVKLSDLAHNIIFLDNNEKCKGHSFREISIFSPISHEILTDATVIICSFLSEKAIKYQLQELGVHNIVQYRDVLSENDYDTLSEAFKSITADELQAIAPQYVNLIEVGAQKIRNALLAVQSKVTINNLNLVPTLRCTLKCRDCSAFNPYFAKQEDFETADVCNGIRRLSELTDRVVMCTILGGEPFLHQDIGAIAEYASSLDNIVSVSINTNGTVLPTQETCEKLVKLNPFSIIISDYGRLSRHKDSLIEKMHNLDIKTAVLENISWYDFCKIVDEDSRTPAEINATYKICSIACAGLVKNLFSKCYPALLLELLGAIPPHAYGEASVIDLTTATREDIERHLNSDIPMQACAVCSGKSRLTKQIPPAVQTDRLLPYKKYK